MGMKRRSFLKTMGAGACLAVSSGALRADEPPEGAPNIILCMADDQGWGDMAYSGHPVLRTPHFDQMASQSLQLDRFYAQAPVCSPTRGSVMTGRHPNRFGCFQWGHTLRPREVTVAEALKSAGYATGHFGKWHLGPVRKPSPVNPGSSGFDHWLSAPNFFDNDPILSREGRAVQTEGESSIVTVDAALEFIRQQADSPRPFLAVVWFGSPHRPHRAAGRFRKMYSDQPKHMRDFYGEITGMDYAVGKLRRGLRELDMHEDTVLWYCSDNGGLKNESSGGRGRKGQIYEGGLRVPALLEWPGNIDGGRTTEVPGVTSDIYPTLLDLLGIGVEDQLPLDGISLVPLLQGDMGERPQPIGFWDYPTGGYPIPSAELMPELLKGQKTARDISPHTFGDEPWKIKKQYPTDTFPGHAAWLDWPWKLHRKEKKGSVELELYNLEEDPGEQNDLVENRPDRVRSMKAALEVWQKDVIGSLNEPLTG